MTASQNARVWCVSKNDAPSLTSARSASLTHHSADTGRAALDTLYDLSRHVSNLGVGEGHGPAAGFIAEMMPRLTAELLCARLHPEVHASTHARHIRDTVPYGNWAMPIGFEKTENGGSCTPGCHQQLGYDRTKRPL